MTPQRAAGHGARGREPRRRPLKLMHQHRLERVLVVDDELRAARPDHRQGHPEGDRASRTPCKDALGKLRVGAAVGVGEGTEERVAALVEAGVDVIVVDTAHGHSQGVLDRVAWIKKLSKVDVIGGNVAPATARARWSTTAPTASRSASAPARSAPRASSPASACRRSPRSRTSPRPSRRTVPLIADGGIRYSGDIAKAIAAGAHCVMLGWLFAGTEESPGEIELYQGRSYKSYRGMGSLGAMQKAPPTATSRTRR